MSPLIRRAERVVETHRDVADEETAFVRNFQMDGQKLDEILQAVIRLEKISQ